MSALTSGFFATSVPWESPGGWGFRVNLGVGPSSARHSWPACCPLPPDFCQLSGMHLLVGRYLEAGPAGLRWRAAQLIGTCSQNVAAIQEQVLGLGALRKLLRLLDRDPCDAVRVKALFAISCECPGRGGGGWGQSAQRADPWDEGRGPAPAL